MTYKLTQQEMAPYVDQVAEAYNLYPTVNSRFPDVGGVVTNYLESRKVPLTYKGKNYSYDQTLNKEMTVSGWISDVVNLLIDVKSGTYSHKTTELNSGGRLKVKLIKTEAEQNKDLKQLAKNVKTYMSEVVVQSEKEELLGLKEKAVQKAAKEALEVKAKEDLALTKLDEMAAQKLVQDAEAVRLVELEELYG